MTFFLCLSLNQAYLEILFKHITEWGTTKPSLRGLLNYPTVSQQNYNYDTALPPPTGVGNNFSNFYPFECLLVILTI